MYEQTEAIINHIGLHVMLINNLCTSAVACETCMYDLNHVQKDAVLVGMVMVTG